MKIWSIVLMVCMAFVSLNADAAKRLGGGKSVGQQSSNVTQRDAAGPAKAPAQNAANPAPAGAAAAAAAPKKPWGAMLGGLAAGLGLAWLAHSLGLGEAFGQFIMIAMGVMLVMVVVGMIMRARNAKAQAGNGAGNGAGGLALQGAGGAPVDVATARSYNPSNVGNDASARPWERNSMSFDNSRMGADAQAGAAGGSMIGSGLRDTSSWGIPVDFDRDGFLMAAKGNFVSLQSAWDRSDIPALRAMMTDSMLAEIKTQLADRDVHREATHDGVPVPTSVNFTEVVMLDAQLLGIEDVGDHYMASVEFSGMIREEPSAGPNAFREVWNMSKPKTGGGWLVAGVQALQ
jgi:predicted lipid-binding transport protein (Tim44 family)